MKRLLKPAILSILALGASFAVAQDITPTRVGPVSQYGQLMTGKNSQGKGRIYGSCDGVKDGAEVQVRGMSLYWSLKPEAVEFWTEEGIATMVNDMNIQIVRAAMATGTEDWWGCKDGTSDCGSSNHLTGYTSDPTTQTNFMKTVVEAAIKNDIYVIIDWHSHNAHEQTDLAKGFFKEMAETYGQYDNVIFELYNEPIGSWGEDAARDYWSTIETYAKSVIPTIREISDNLILVGTPYYDQYPNVVTPIDDSNIAYTFHYYASSHYPDVEGANAVTAMNNGLSIFVSEWGTGSADGGGSPDQSQNESWQNFVNEHKLSWANWSASRISEGTAAFTSGATKTNLQYTASGNMVKGFLATNPTTYTKCATNGGSNNGGGNEDALFTKANIGFSATFANNTLYIAGTPASVEIFSVQGTKLMTIDHVSGTLSLASLPAGKYIARIRSNSANLVRAIQIK